MKKQIHFGEMLFGLYKTVVTGFFVSILSFLLFFASFSTCYMVTDWTEKTFFVKDSVLLNLGSVVVVVLVMTTAKKIKVFQEYLARIEKEENTFRKCRKILLGIILGMALVWVLATQCCTQGDQEFIQNATYDLNTKNNLLFLEGGYLYRFAQQRGMTGISYLISLIFGSYNYISLQILNVIGVVLFYYEMSEICGQFGMGRVVRLKVLLYGILFFPLILYCALIYGNIWGLTLAMVAIKHEIRFLENKKIRNAIVSALAIVLTLLLKSNYIIFLIGIIIIAFIEMIRKKEVKFLLLPALAIVLWMGQGKAVTAIFEEVSGVSFGQEASKWSWIAMGLQEGIRAPGWYNDFVWYTYDESGYRTDVHDGMVKEAIKESLHGFMTQKWYAVEFFTKKTVSQWNNPTFQAFWIVQVQPTAVVRSNWVWHLLSAEGTHKTAGYLNLLQFIILVGALLYCIMYRNSADYGKSLMFAMIFVGGVICHLIWEAKGQYALAYFVLLFPYAAAGYNRLTDYLAAAIGNGAIQKQSYRIVLKDFMQGKSRAAIGVMVLVAGVITGGIGILCAGGCCEYLTADTEAYRQYLKEMDVTPKLAEGVYRFRTDGGFVLSHRKDETGSLVLCGAEEADGADNIRVVNFQDTTWFHFVESNQYILASGVSFPEGSAVTAEISGRGAEERWSVKEAEGGGFYFVCNKFFALTYDEEKSMLYLAPFLEEYNQIWYADLQQ